MDKEKRFILVNRIVSLLILLLNIFLPIILMKTQTDLELLDSQVYYTFDEATGYSNCQVELTFNKTISSGSVMIYFYDNSGNLIDTETAYFYEDGKTVTDELNYINGEIDRYELSSLNFSTPFNLFYDCAYLLWYFIAVTLTMFIGSLLLSYKTYKFNGNTISIYAGYYNHYIKVNGEKFDEHKTLASFTPIILSCTLEDGNQLQATISTTNRIALKINDKLFNN